MDDRGNKNYPHGLDPKVAELIKSMLAVQAAKKVTREARVKRWNEYTTHNTNVAIADDDSRSRENFQGSQTSTTDDSNDQYDSDEQVDLAYFTEHDQVDDYKDEEDASNDADEYPAYSKLEDLPKTPNAHKGRRQPSPQNPRLRRNCPRTNP